MQETRSRIRLFPLLLKATLLFVLLTEGILLNDAVNRVVLVPGDPTYPLFGEPVIGGVITVPFVEDNN